MWGPGDSPGCADLGWSKAWCPASTCSPPLPSPPSEAALGQRGRRVPGSSPCQAEGALHVPLQGRQSKETASGPFLGQWGAKARPWSMLCPDPYHVPNFLLHLVPSAQRAATEGGGGAAELHSRARLLEAARPQQAARSDPRLPGHLCAAREWRAPRPTHHPGRHAGRGPGVTPGGGRVGETRIFHSLFGTQVCSPPLPALRGTVTPRHPAVIGLGKR